MMRMPFFDAGLLRAAAAALAAAVLFAGCATESRLPPPSPSFAAYVAQTRADIAVHRRFATADRADEVNRMAPWEMRPEHPDGRAVLFIHGLGDSPWTFRDTGAELAREGILVRTVLLPGHGTRPPHSAPRPVPPRPDPHRVHPARRPPIAHRPVRFWDSGYHYFGYRISSLPTRYVRRVFWGVPYYIVDNVYYRYYGGSYYVSRPPFGVVFTPTVSLVDAICSFAFYADAYYTFSTVNENANLITEQNRIIAENNATIAAQNATIAQQNATIAAQNATIAANAAGASSLNSHLATESSRLADRLGLVQSYASVSDSYYYDDGIFFTKNKSGEYVTIVPPAGALITELSDDYRIVTLGGDEYYAVDDTVYRTTVIDGSVYFEVLGQMTGELAAQYEV